MKTRKKLRHFGRKHCLRCGKSSKIFYGDVCASCYTVENIFRVDEDPEWIKEMRALYG